MLKRQAVLVIHGIGDQRPMDTLRSFVETASDAGPDKRWSRPDGVSENFDLRQIVTVSDNTRTDFFELYWAHLMEGTRLASVWCWIFSITWRFLWSGALKFRMLAVSVGLLLIVIGFSILDLGVKITMQIGDVRCFACSSIAKFVRTEPSSLTCVELGVLLVVVLISGFLRKYVGDAARYLRAKPENIGARQAIRRLGVRAIRHLHDEKHGYERIIVVGHSLGSIIGYDILNYAFVAMPLISSPPLEQPLIQALRDKSRVLEEAKPATVKDALDSFQATQRALARGTPNWRVTDFVTVGSPLTYVATLMANGPDDLAKRVAQREFPACPPVVDGSEFCGFYVHPTGDLRAHHAAAFAFTRWTNLYFPWFLVFWGDVIGGAIPRALGAGIRNVRVRTHHLCKIRLFSHTSYWTKGGLLGDPDHIRALKAALDLDDKGTAASLPPVF